MAVTILERPIGVILDTCVDATINMDYNGFATVNKTSHGLSDNEWVYIQGNVENYNGFWQIDVINANEFALKQYDGTYLPYIVNADVTYCPQLSTHGFSCVHLPITYRLTNNLFPTNTADATRTITGLSNDLGFARVTLSAALASSFEELIFVKISSAPDSDLDGIYQIIDKISTSSFTLNVTYETFTNSGLIGASIQIYHGNATINVEVWAGINSSHTWASEKPYELAATLELIPDANNEVLFSINEILKAYVQSKNNLQLATLPNNIDAWCNFYIKTAQGFDDSNGYTITRMETTMISDQPNFEGVAVNAMLHFKNIHSGHLSEYVMNNTSAKFLTMFVIPVLFACSDSDCYQDISFILPYDDAVVTVRYEYYNNGVLITTVDEFLATLDSGVIRAPLTRNCAYDRVDITIIADIHVQFSNEDFPSSIDGWENFNGSDRSSATSYRPFAFSGGNAVTTASASIGTKYFATQLGDGSGMWPIGSYVVQITGIGFSDGSFVNPAVYGMANSSSQTSIAGQVSSGSFALDGTTTVTRTLTFTTLQQWQYLAFVFDSDGLNMTMSISEITILSSPTINEELSETKTIEIDCGCDDQEKMISWLNPLGGFDYWKFKAETGYAVEISSTTETTKNILPEWPKSYGENADTIRKQTSRDSANRLFLTSQLVTEDQADALAFIKTSPLVQIINSRTDRRTIIVDSDSFTKYTDNQKVITISFNARFTDNIGSQRV